jgi:hypothetical protein
MKSFKFQDKRYVEMSQGTWLECSKLGSVKIETVVVRLIFKAKLETMYHDMTKNERDELTNAYFAKDTIL